jgi:hypothetical protein
MKKHSLRKFLKYRLILTPTSQDSCVEANTNIHWAGIPWPIRKLGDSYCLHEPTLIPVLSPMNPAHYFISRFFKTQCNIMPLSTPSSQVAVSLLDGFLMIFLMNFLPLLCLLLHFLLVSFFLKILNTCFLRFTVFQKELYSFEGLYKCIHQWPESASELCRPSD